MKKVVTRIAAISARPSNVDQGARRMRKARAPPWRARWRRKQRWVKKIISQVKRAPNIDTAIIRVKDCLGVDQVEQGRQGDTDARQQQRVQRHALAAQFAEALRRAPRATG